jgi:hypothetical protein
MSVSGSKSIESSYNAHTPRLDIFYQTLSEIKHDLVDKDEYFLNNLSSEYKFLLEHLISRCTFNLETMLDEDDKASSKDPNTSTSSSLTIEEQKNLALFYLSSKNFGDFMLANFDLELLAELLNDLLYALPNSLIPFRYIDIVIYSAISYDTCQSLMMYLPRSHLILFELIVKFLQIYSKCLATCASNFNDVLADAIFQANKTKTDNSKNQAPSEFLKLFVNNHTKFLAI